MNISLFINLHIDIPKDSVALAIKAFRNYKTGYQC